MRRGTQILVAALGMGFTAAGPEAAERFVVGPDAKYKSISTALAEMKDGDVCVIREGVYREHIDVALNNVTLRGEGRVVVTGCDEAGAMRACEVNGRQALSKVVGVPVYGVFQGNRYLSMARYPSKTAPMTSNMDWEDTFINPDQTVTFTNGAPESLTDGYYVGLHGSFPSRSGLLSSWHALTLPITGLGEDGSIRVDAERAASGFMGKYGQGRGLGYIIGAKAALDDPGEWHSDGAEVTLIPQVDGKGNYEFRTRLYGATITGNNVRLESIRFKAATARVGGDDVTLKGCAFEYISPFQHNANDAPANKKGQSMRSGWGAPENGSAGVFVAGDRFVAEDCRFAKSWWCGMMLRGNQARVENCLFEDMNWMAKRCAGLFCWGDDNVVRYCTFRNLGAAAVEGGNANWIGQYAKNNIWEYNYIEDVSKMIVDQGFFYVNQQSGTNPKANTVWRYNVGRKSRGPAKGKWTQTTVGYYVDNSSSGYRIHNNIAIDANEAMRYNDTRDGDQAGKDIWYFNNTFFKCSTVAYGCFSGGRGKATPDADVNIANNLVVSCGPDLLSKWKAKDKWRDNVETSSPTALRDPEGMDFTPVAKELLRPGVPVRGEAFSYVGAVDPEKGMWRYGADESQLPDH